MTAVATRPTARTWAVGRADLDDRAERDGAARDALMTALWLAGVGAVSLAMAAGHPVSTIGDALTFIGRATGIVAATTMMVQLLVIARVPAIERRFGHDRAALLHGTLGRIGFVVMAAHVVTLLLGYAARLRAGWWDQAWSFVVGYGIESTLAVVSFWLLIAVVATSLAAVRARWRYESWHGVHLVTYLVIALAIPHQFVLGTTFSGAAGAATDTFARWYWAALWTVSVGAFLAYRVVQPFALAARHRLRVAHVERGDDGSVSLWIAGRRLDRLGAEAGQFFLWRLLTPGLWTEAHPFSLSAAPDGTWLRLTVKPVGDHTAALADVLPGTRVMAEGPLGRFTLRRRRAYGTVLAGAGSGIAPIIALLGAREPARDGAGPIVVFLRARTEYEIPHLDEVRALARAKGATLYLLTGRRGSGWLPAGQAAPMSQLVPALGASDVYVCGPRAWSEDVLNEARRCGAPEEHLHVEEFAW